MFGAIFKKGRNYSSNVQTSAFDVTFSPDINTGLESRNVNDAINEMAHVLVNIAEQFSSHSFTFGSNRIQSLKDTLLYCSRSVGNFCGFQMAETNGTVSYVGYVFTSGSKCTFTLRGVTNGKLYFGAFDNLNSNSFKMYEFSQTNEVLGSGTVSL